MQIELTTRVTASFSEDPSNEELIAIADEIVGRMNGGTIARWLGGSPYRGHIERGLKES